MPGVLLSTWVLVPATIRADEVSASTFGTPPSKAMLTGSSFWLNRKVCPSALASATRRSGLLHSRPTAGFVAAEASDATPPVRRSTELTPADSTQNVSPHG